MAKEKIRAFERGLNVWARMAGASVTKIAQLVNVSIGTVTKVTLALRSMWKTSVNMIKNRGQLCVFGNRLMKYMLDCPGWRRRGYCLVCFFFLSFFGGLCVLNQSKYLLTIIFLLQISTAAKLDKWVNKVPRTDVLYRVATRFNDLPSFIRK